MILRTRWLPVSSVSYLHRFKDDILFLSRLYNAAMCKTGQMWYVRKWIMVDILESFFSNGEIVSLTERSISWLGVQQIVLNPRQAEIYLVSSQIQET